MQAGNIQALIEKQKELYRVQAAKEKIIELYKQQIELEEQMEEELVAVEAAEREYQKAVQELDAEIKEHAQRGESYYGELTEAEAEAKQKVLETREQLQESSTAYNGLTENI